MAATTGNTAMDDVFATWINQRFVSDLDFTLQHQKFVNKAEIVKGSGANIARFVDYSPPIRTGYAAGATAMTEASTTANEIASITTNATNITVAEYGEFLKIGQLYEYAAVSGTRDKLRKRIRDGGLVAIDGNIEAAARGSTTIFYATAAQTGGTTTAPANTTAMGASTLMGARKVLFDNKCRGFEGLPGVRAGNFGAVITPKQEIDITTEVTTGRTYWSNMVVNVPGAMGQEKTIYGHIGDIYGTSVFVTNSYATTTYTATVDIGYVYGDGGLAGVSFEDMDPKVILNEVNSPYKNVNSIAWHLFGGWALHSAARVVKLYSLS